MIVYLIVAVYLLFMLAIGVAGKQLGEDTPDDYFLAGRALGPVVLFFTLIATNFSAFFFLGFAGAGYRVGYAYYPIMAFGTALVGVAFYFIGFPAWRLGRERGYVTPPEMLGDLTGSRAVRLLTAAVMIWFTIPYLAIQPIGAGLLLSELTNGAIPDYVGASALTVCMVFYVFLGGMRSVAITDVVQGVMMFVLMALAVMVIGDRLGGLSDANARVLALEPGLYSRTGRDGFFTERNWFSYMMLWILAVPMFPQVFMRFFTPGSAGSLRTATVLYPIVTATLFIGPIIIGVLGHLTHPGLAGAEADRILPMMLAEFAPSWLAALVMVGALAAFMSTMDSQLLALSSMVTRDLYVAFVKPHAGIEEQVRVGRVAVVGLAAVGLAIAIRPPATIFGIATEAFTGLAVLFPSVVAAIYLPRTPAWAFVLSIVVGQVLLVASHYRVLPEGWAMGFLPVTPIVGAAAVMVIVGAISRPRRAVRAAPG